MIQRRGEAALFLAVIALMGIGIHKIETSTTDQLQASQAQIAYNTHHAQELAWTICGARNEAIVKSNVRWNNEKLAWTAAAAARRAQAQTATPADAKIDLAAAKVYQRVADGITPYVKTDCGPKP